MARWKWGGRRTENERIGSVPTPWLHCEVFAHNPALQCSNVHLFPKGYKPVFLDTLASLIYATAGRKYGTCSSFNLLSSMHLHYDQTLGSTSDKMNTKCAVNRNPTHESCPFIFQYVQLILSASRDATKNLRPLLRMHLDCFLHTHDCT